MRGWVYVITNQAMPGLVKVGFSTKDPEARGRQLGGSGTPHPFVVEYDVLVCDPREVEQRAHDALSQFHEQKEWFRCAVPIAIDAIRRQATNILAENIARELTHSAAYEAPDLWRQARDRQNEESLRWRRETAQKIEQERQEKEERDRRREKAERLYGW